MSISLNDHEKRIAALENNKDGDRVVNLGITGNEIMKDMIIASSKPWSNYDFIVIQSYSVERYKYDTGFTNDLIHVNLGNFDDTMIHSLNPYKISCINSNTLKISYITDRNIYTKIQNIFGLKL